MATETTIRLPKEVRPVKYDLMLTPNLESFTFQGEETILIQVMETTKNIVMHAAELEISSAKLTPESHLESMRDTKDIIEPTAILLDEKSETVTLSFDDPFEEFARKLDQLSREFFDRFSGR